MNLNLQNLFAISSKILEEVKEQINRDVGGSVILHWRPDQVQETLIPIISKSTQLIIKKILLNLANYAPPPNTY